MVPRERLLRLAATVTARATARRVRVAGQLLLLAGLVFVLLRLRSIWQDSHIELSHVRWGWMVGALALTACGVLATGFIWLVILSRLGTRTQPRWAAIYFQAQLGKYIPGTVWQYASRAAIARARGVPLRPVAVSIPVELAATTLAAGAFSLLLLGLWGAVGAAILLALAILSTRRRRRALLVRVSDRLRNRASAQGLLAAASALPLYACVWLAVGSGFWLLARGLVGTAASDIPFYIGAFTAAWLVGLFALYAPGGLGVREAMLVVILRGRLGSADALVLAAASRALLTFLDIAAALFGVLLGRRHQPVSSGPGSGELTRVGP
jgi:glycosyltransferase 2 family protein